MQILRFAQNDRLSKERSELAHHDSATFSGLPGGWMNRSFAQVPASDAKQGEFAVPGFGTPRFLVGFEFRIARVLDTPTCGVSVTWSPDCTPIRHATLPGSAEEVTHDGFCDGFCDGFRRCVSAIGLAMGFRDGFADGSPRSVSDTSVENDFRAEGRLPGRWLPLPPRRFLLKTISARRNS